MKNKNILIRFLGLTICILGSISLVSCLEDADETIALERGKATTLLLGTWKVDKSELYDLNTSKYHSDMPDDGALDYVYTFNPDGIGELFVKEVDVISWSINEDDKTISIDGVTYNLVSLGEKVMVIELVRNVNGDTYRHRYVLVKTKGSNYALDNDDDDNNGDDDPNDTPNYEGDEDDDTQVVSSDEGKTFRRYGYTITVPRGAVPTNNSGGAGKVAFSVQLTNDLPKIFNGTLLGEGCLKIEPMNFTFNSPIIINVPLNGYNAYDVEVYWYDESIEEWTLIPISKINPDGTISIAVMELGYFIVARASGADILGGAHISSQYIEKGYFYYLTLTPQENRGYFTHSKVIGFTSDGEDLYMAKVEWGYYNATITREKRSSFTSSATSIETIDLGTIWIVDEKLQPKDWYNITNNFSDWIGWTEISLSGKSWNNGRPSSWGDVTTTYGTGKFQATLTWVNSSTDATDYDLHLTTPQGEVYFNRPQAGAFELDRDWLRAPGNAVENIYSINDKFTPGTYKVRVHHFSGVTGKRYNCRIIVNGTVVKSVTNSISTNKQYDDIYTFTIE